MTSTSSRSRMTINNTSWTPAELLENYHKIKKPKFNRDKIWNIKSSDNKGKKKSANYEEYLQFLFKTKHSVYAISLGVYFNNNEKYYYVIDGNNRINAIVCFFKCPYKVFTSLYNELFNYIDNCPDDKLDQSTKLICKELIQNLSYRELSSFARLDYLLPSDLDLELDRRIIMNIENKLIDIQKQLRFKDNSPYDTHIKLVINEFENGTYKEYCDIFGDINKYSNILSNNELLAGTLCEEIVCINDESLKCSILNKIKDYYDNRGNDEVLETYKMELKCNVEITAYDFMVGFQNYCCDKFNIIDNFSPEGTSLFFKIFGYLYGSIDKGIFTVENVNDFIDKILFASNIICEAFNAIMPVNINDNLFNKTSKNQRSKLIAKNPMTILFISIIANREKMYEKVLIKKIRLVIMYHLLSNKKYLKNVSDEDIEKIKTHDKIEYTAGGSYIDNLCKNILENDNTKIFDISRENFMNLLQENLKSSFNDKTYQQERVTNKRRQLTFFDKILISNFFNKKMPMCFLKERYSIEHICPYSSVWDDLIDINRIGNLFPTLDKINCSRGNNNLDIYYNSANSEFTKFIEDLLPNNYSEINSRDGKKTTIVDIHKYNDFCTKNEKLYIKTLVDDIFSN